jgi:hypothetical protein
VAAARDAILADDPAAHVLLPLAALLQNGRQRSNNVGGGGVTGRDVFPWP